MELWKEGVKETGLGQGWDGQSVPSEPQAASTSGPAGWRKAFSFMKEPLKWRRL